MWFDKRGKQRGESDCISGRNVVTLFSDNRIEVFPGGERRAGFSGGRKDRECTKTTCEGIRVPE